MAIVTLRPDGDGNAVWATTGANRFGVLNDNSDATYCTGPSSGTSSYQSLTMQTTTLTGTQRVKAIKYRMRFQFLGASYVALRFVRAGDSEAKVAIVKQAAAAVAINTVEASFPADASGQEWNNTTLVSLALRLYGTNTNVRVMELYADVDVRNQPTLATPTVTGNTTSSRPTVSWVYSDSDGDPQAAWHLRVFSAAQYGVAGFDPATSPFTLEMKGASGADTVVSNGDLANGVTYKAYVRAAKSFGIGGFDTSTRTFVPDLWYSTWVASSQFTMSFEPIPTPTLTVTPDNTVPHVRNQLSVDTKLNLLTSDDASFEAGLGSWAAVTNCAVLAAAPPITLKGAQALKMTATAGADMVAGTPGGVFGYPVGPNRSYTWLASFLANAATPRSCRIETAFFDGAGVQIGGTVTGGNITDGNGAWTQATLTTTSPTAAAYALVSVRVLVPGAGEVHWVDAVSLSTSSSTTWFAGGVSQVDFELVEYTDLTPAFPAMLANLLNSQLASGGQLQNNPDGYFTRSTKDLLTFDRSQAFLGEGSVRWDVGNGVAGSSFVDFGNANATFDPAMTYMPPCVPGTQYTFSLYVRAGTGTHSMRVVLNSIDASGAVVGSSTNGSTNATIAQAWQRLTVTHTAQTNAVGFRPSLENVNGDIAPFFLGQAQLEEGAAATTWHQGQGLVPAWQPVRGARTALQAEQRTGIAVCWDREAPPGTYRMYRATTIASYPSGTMGASPVSTMVPTKLGLLTLPNGDAAAVLKDPQQPAHDLQVKIHPDNWTEQVSEDLTESHPTRPNAPQGFGQRPVFSSDWISGVGGTLSVQVTDDHDWWRILQLLETKRPLLLQFPEGGQRYVRFTGDRTWSRTPIGTDGNVTRPSRWLRVVSVPLAEVDRPVVLA